MIGVSRIHSDAFDLVALDRWIRRRDVPVELFVVFVPLDGVDFFASALLAIVVIIILKYFMAGPRST